MYTFGFGDDHDANLLEAISQAAEGAYYYIDSAKKVHIHSDYDLLLSLGVCHSFLYACVQIPESFADCLGGLLSVVGQNIELSLACVNGCSLVGAHAKNPPKMSDENTK